MGEREAEEDMEEDMLKIKLDHGRCTLPWKLSGCSNSCLNIVFTVRFLQLWLYRFCLCHIFLRYESGHPHLLGMLPDFKHWCLPVNKQ